MLPEIKSRAALRRFIHTFPEEESWVVVYTGEGTSHSWLWVGETLEALGWKRVVFSASLTFDVLSGAGACVVSGGDTFAIAESLGHEGATALRSFIRSGGLYIGTCAGGYLVLRSSKEPLNLFNFIRAPIANLREVIPEPVRMKEKFAQPYGCRYVFHPVRGEIEIHVVKNFPFVSKGIITAPIYGGPVMEETEEVEVIARYCGFTDKTEFLVDREFADEIYTGRAAAVRAAHKDLKIYAFGPHIEHPEYEEANLILGKLLVCEGKRTEAEKEVSHVDALDIHKIRALASNLRIALESKTRRLEGWKGSKYLMAYHFLTFVNAIWDKVRRKRNAIALPEEVEEVRTLLEESLSHVKSGELEAGTLLSSLNSCASHVFNWHFRAMRTEKRDLSSENAAGI